MQDSTIDAILRERGKTHGRFADNARVTQRIKDMIRSELHTMDHFLSVVQNEALDMIAHKIGRIVAGNPNVEDHWRDIAGYATLVADELRSAQQKENDSANQ